MVINHNCIFLSFSISNLVLILFLCFAFSSFLLVLDQDPVRIAGRGTILLEISRAIVVITVVSVATGGPFSTTGAEGVATSHEGTIIEVGATMVTVPTMVPTGTAIENSSSHTTTSTALGGGARVPTHHGRDHQAEAIHGIPVDLPQGAPDVPALPPAPHPHDDATRARDDPTPKKPKEGLRRLRAREQARRRPSLQEAAQRSPVVSGKAYPTTRPVPNAMLLLLGLNQRLKCPFLEVPAMVVHCGEALALPIKVHRKRRQPQLALGSSQRKNRRRKTNRPPSQLLSKSMFLILEFECFPSLSFVLQAVFNQSSFSQMCLVLVQHQRSLEE